MVRKSKNFWADLLFINDIREIKWARQNADKKEYSDMEITRMLRDHPLFIQLKKQLSAQEQQFTAQIKIQMDKKRGGFG